MAEDFEKISYDPETGIFRWLGRYGSSHQEIGAQAGSIDKKCYRILWVNGRRYKAHRLAWFLMTGKWPNRIDHANRDKDDNRWCNLREATNGENRANSVDASASGCKGVYRHYNRWRVDLKRQRNVERFSDLVTACVCANYHILHLYGQFGKISKIPGEWPHD